MKTNYQLLTLISNKFQISEDLQHWLNTGEYPVPESTATATGTLSKTLEIISDTNTEEEELSFCHRCRHLAALKKNEPNKQRS